MSKIYKNGLTRKEMIEMYREGVSTAIIAKEFGITPRGVTYIMNKEGVKTKNVGQPRVYDVNEDFFKTWSNEMAYVLGLVVADGHINKSVHSVCFYHNDRKILERVAKFLESEHKIVKVDSSLMYKFSIHSKIIKNDLIKLGISSGNKSSIVRVPNTPEEYLPCFIRGYFDGDGNTNKKGYTATMSTVSKHFAIDLYKLMLHWNIKTTFKKDKSYDIYRVYISGKESVTKFAKIVYNVEFDEYVSYKQINLSQNSNKLSEKLRYSFANKGYEYSSMSHNIITYHKHKD